MAQNEGKPPYTWRNFAQSQPSTSSAAADEDMVTTAHEAKAVLRHLLAELQNDQNPYSKRYKEWIEKSEGLERFLFGCLRPEVLMFLKSGSWTTDAVRNISGDLRFDGRAIYIHSIYGLDKRLRLYVGQSQCLVRRLKDHWSFRFRRDNPSLHYHAMQYSSFDTFSVLAVLPQPTNPSYHTIPGVDQPQLILNVLEMWCCLLFHSLPEETLRQYLPSGSTVLPKRGAGGLNIASPLDHGGKGRRDWIDLSRSKDPLVKEYLEVGDRKRSAVGSASEQTRERTPTEIAQPATTTQGNRERRHDTGSQEIPVTPSTVLVIVAAIGLSAYLIKRKMQ